QTGCDSRCSAPVEKNRLLNFSFCLIPGSEVCEVSGGRNTRKCKLNFRRRVVERFAELTQPRDRCLIFLLSPQATERGCDLEYFIEFCWSFPHVSLGKGLAAL